MALPLYLAMTAPEMAGNPHPDFPAYMACHFSPGGPGLSNLPENLPPGAILMLDDSTPMDGHDPDTVLKQLSSQTERWQCGFVLLDFQRPDIHAQRKLAEYLTRHLPCPAAVSECYARDLSCPVFLPPVPPDMHLKDWLAPWKNREIWLEAALDGLTLTLNEDGCVPSSLPDFPEWGLRDERLHCHYAMDSPATFRLWRTREDLDVLLNEAENLGVTKAVGLWQELGK